MKTSAHSRTVIAAANVLSSVMAPLFVPTYGMIVALTCTGLAGLDSGVRWRSLLVVFALTAALPLFLLWLMKRRGIISDIDVSNRAQRTLPVAMMLMCYGLTVGYIVAVHAPLWLIMYFASGIITAVILGLITTIAKWKISMHGAGMGNFMAMIVAIWAGGHALHPMPVLLSVAILLAGAVGSSRVILNRHTLAQVLAGTAISAAVTYISMLI